MQVGLHRIVPKADAMRAGHVMMALAAAIMTVMVLEIVFFNGEAYTCWYVMSCLLTVIDKQQHRSHAADRSAALRRSQRGT